MTWEEKYGAEKAREMKAKLRRNRFPVEKIYPTPFARHYKLKSLPERDREAEAGWEKTLRRLAYIEKVGGPLKYAKIQKQNRERQKAKKNTGKVLRFPNPFMSPEDQ